MAYLNYGRQNLDLDVSLNPGINSLNGHLNINDYGPYDLYFNLSGTTTPSNPSLPTGFTLTPGSLVGQTISFFTNSDVYRYVLLQGVFLTSNTFINLGRFYSFVWIGTTWIPYISSSADDGSLIPVAAYNADWTIFINVVPIDGGRFALLTGGAESNKDVNTSPIGVFPPQLNGVFQQPSVYIKASDSSVNNCIIAAGMVPPPLGTFGVDTLALANGDFVSIDIFYQTRAS